MLRRVVLGALATVLVLAVATTALADRLQVRLTPAGQAGARAVLPAAAEIGTGWVAKPYKPDLTSEVNCGSFNPKQSDLIVNGSAGVRFTGHPGIELNVESEVLQTSRMVALDWQRSIQAPGLIACMRKGLVASLPSYGRFVSLKRLSFPKVATYTIAFRYIMEVKARDGSRPRVFLDMLDMARGRTELSMMFSGPLAAEPAIRAAEVRLAWALTGRAVL